MYINACRKSAKGMEPGSVSVAQCQDQRQGAQTEKQEICSEQQETYFTVRMTDLHPWNYSKNVWTWSQATSVLFCARALKDMSSRGPFQPQLSCDSLTCKDVRIMINIDPSILTMLGKFDFPLLMPFQSHGIRKKCGLILPVFKLPRRSFQLWIVE